MPEGRHVSAKGYITSELRDSFSIRCKPDNYFVHMVYIMKKSYFHNCLSLYIGPKFILPTGPPFSLVWLWKLLFFTRHETTNLFVNNKNSIDSSQQVV